MEKIWIVTAVDASETADGKARVLAACRTEEQARAFVRYEMEAYADDAAGMDLVVDFDKMSARTADGSYGCEWNAEAVEPPV